MKTRLSRASEEEIGEGVRRANVLIPAVVLVLLALAACGGDDRTATLDLDPARPAFATWEEAALAEAGRLHPGLSSPEAARVEVAPLSERIRVSDADGYCRLFGGKFRAGEGWQANDLGAC
jgi:hypothetical protein